ncbi:MAG: hypothetical protein LKH33_10000 [Acetobacter sp.]|jgi:hypothetical protein|nr:hypothetical protein [Acetobacter sp.]MCH4088946.1 hypothetical protein [Acetobacter sp.]MCI1486124.1 hypothetical protein [Acetobacter sp.]MCI1602281.1 hypothetical protein [Acetobacter sp.]
MMEKLMDRECHLLHHHPDRESLWKREFPFHIRSIDPEYESRNASYAVFEREASGRKQNVRNDWLAARMECTG